MLKTTLVGLLAIATSTLAVDTDADPSLNDQLLLAPTMRDRWNILTSAAGNQWKYDFATNPQYPYRNNPGSVCNANQATWPALTGMGATVAQLNLGPCSMLPPHEHRDPNVVVGIQGTTHTMMVQENGVGLIEQDISPGQATIFPRGSLHTMFNSGSFLLPLYLVTSHSPPNLVLTHFLYRLHPQSTLQLPPRRRPRNREFNEWDDAIRAGRRPSHHAVDGELQRCSGCWLECHQCSSASDWERE
jgi:hypothetical protein